MLPPELAKQIRLLEIRTNRAVDEITGGAYRSVFKGRGIEFEEVREYTPEDDVRDIDWNVSARMGSPYIKKYVEERELTVLLLVDVSASGAFGSAEKSKRRTAAELAALLAFSAGRNGDKVGLLMFSDRIELYVPPRSGRSHTLRLIREMLAFRPQSGGTDIDLALRESAQLLKKRSVVFLLSDLIDRKEFETSLKLLNRRHDGSRFRFSTRLNTAGRARCRWWSKTRRAASWSGSAAEGGNSVALRRNWNRSARRGGNSAAAPGSISSKSRAAGRCCVR